jgi:hypothetical protein
MGNKISFFRNFHSGNKKCFVLLQNVERMRVGSEGDGEHQTRHLRHRIRRRDHHQRGGRTEGTGEPEEETETSGQCYKTFYGRNLRIFAIG